MCQPSSLFVLAGMTLFLADGLLVLLAPPDSVLRPAHDIPAYAQLLFGPSGEEAVLLEVREGEVHAYRGTKPQGTAMATAAVGQADEKRGWFTIDMHGLRYVVTRINAFDHRDTRSLAVYVRVEGSANYEAYASLELDASPRNCAVGQFGGRLSAGPALEGWRVPKSLKLVRGAQPTDLQAIVGTMDEARRTWVAVLSCNAGGCTFPEGVRPEVEVEYPSAAPGAPPIKRQYTLDGFC